MNIALILSGGTGNRVGATVPKQYLEIDGRMMIDYCMETIFKHERISAVVIVAEPSYEQIIRDEIVNLFGARTKSLSSFISGEKRKEALAAKFRGFAKPGETRQLSILHGLEAIRKFASDSDIVFIHDAARPLLSKSMINDCFAAMDEGYDGVMPVLPMKDTVYMSRDGKMINSLVNRDELYAGQAPELFEFGKYYRANVSLLPDRIKNIRGSSEPAVLAGMRIAMIPGDERNIKVTTRTDLDLFTEYTATGRQR